MEKAYFELCKQNKKIEVQFNPSEYSISDGSSYSSSKKKEKDSNTGTKEEKGVNQFIGENKAVLNLTLYFDTYIPPSLGEDGSIIAESGTDVSIKTKEIVNFVRVVGAEHKPSVVIFHWGSLHFRGTVTSVNQQYTMFLSSGMPVRAKLSVSISEFYDDEYKKQETPFESPDRSKYKTVSEGDALWRYAYEEYGSSTNWRVIAEENNIDNPLNLPNGMLVKLPAIKL